MFKDEFFEFNTRFGALLAPFEAVAFPSKQEEFEDDLLPVTGGNEVGGFREPPSELPGIDCDLPLPKEFIRELEALPIPFCLVRSLTRVAAHGELAARASSGLVMFNRGVVLSGIPMIDSKVTPSLVDSLGFCLGALGAKYADDRGRSNRFSSATLPRSSAGDSVLEAFLERVVSRLRVRAHPAEGEFLSSPFLRGN